MFNRIDLQYSSEFSFSPEKFYAIFRNAKKSTIIGVQVHSKVMAHGEIKNRNRIKEKESTEGVISPSAKNSVRHCGLLAFDFSCGEETRHLIYHSGISCCDKIRPWDSYCSRDTR